MLIKQPKNNEKYYWTQHVYGKMQHYAISEQTVRRIIRNPELTIEGVAPNTIAVMQTRGNKQKYELWVMYQLAPLANNKSQITNNKHKQIRVITTWKYPGISPKDKSVPIPEDILEEINEIL